MSHSREQQASAAYLKLLQNKGASPEILIMRQTFLQTICAELADKHLQGTEYRKAIEAVMESMPADSWHECLTTAREFYVFWMQDFKAIAAFSISAAFNLELNQWSPRSETSLKALADRLETEKFETSETWPLKAYTQALRYEGAEQTLVDTRVKLAKIILMRLRDAPDRSRKHYRTAVDLTLPLFNVKQNRHLFLVVVREFYHFWTGNPDAGFMVLKDGSSNILE